jgi:hypothetical protein
VVLALPRAAAGIPTLIQGGLWLLGVLAAVMGWWQLRRRVS